MKKIEFRKIDDLIPYARNSRTHSEAQVLQLAASINEWGFTNPVLADADGIIAGHGRCLAARKIYENGADILLPNGDQVPDGCVPVIDVSGWSKAKRKAYIIADNKLALNSDWDMEMLSVEMEELGELGYDSTLMGFGKEEAAEFFNEEPTHDGDSEYSNKIEPPTYTPKEEQAPPLDILTKNEKHDQLAEKIKADQSISADEKAFLLKAATRHTIFDYHQIAEYYCHATPAMQSLMEDSALIIIDFNKAIEGGYVQLTKKLEGIYGESYGEDDDEQ